MGAALVTASCTGPTVPRQAQARPDKKDSLNSRPAADDSLASPDSSLKPLSAGYCPPCGRG